MEKQSGVAYWLSPQQKLAWFSQGAGTLWNATSLVLLEGPLNLERLHQALDQVVSRQEILRTVYRVPAGMKVPFQVVLESSSPVWENVDLKDLDAAAQQARLEELFSRAQQRSFDLENGPVLYACLAVLSDRHTALILSLPAASSDTVSLGALVRELGTVYAGRSQELHQEPLPYAQFAQWQNDLLEGDDENAQSAKAFWSQQKTASPLVLPQEAPQAGESLQPVTVTLSGDILSKIDGISAKYGVSIENTLLAAWQVTLWRLTSQAHFHTRVFTGGREYEELAGTLGLIGKFLPIPARFDGDYSFVDVVKRLREARSSAAEWQEHFAPGDGAEAGSSIAFEYSELPAAQSFDAVAFSVLRQEACCERFALRLAAGRQGDSLALTLHFDASALRQATVERWSRSFQTLLAAALETPLLPVARLPLLDAGDRQMLLVDWNRTQADYPRDKCMHELFEAQAARTPLRPAVRCGEQSLTYRELNEQANQLAHHLRRLGVGLNARVGVCLDRSTDMIIAVLAVLKAGGAFIPLSPDNPKPRLAQQLAGVHALLTEEKFVALLPSVPGSTLALDRDRGLWSAAPLSNPLPLSKPDDLVYVIYTSGSTGVPKGVAVRHRNLVNYAWFITRRLELDRFPDGLHFATVSTLSADLGNTCIYPSLISGGCLHVIPFDTAADSQRFGSYTAQYPIDVLKIVPSHLAALLDSSQARQILPRQFLVMGGEALTPLLLEQIATLQPDCEIFNHYGPTETTVGSLTLRLRDYDWRHTQTIPIGKPIANTRVYILDAQREPVPVGVVGELYIAGDGVTAGYLDQPALTAERFFPDPFAGGEMYRTGDLARYQPDGNVEFLGRGDDQVKIRGFRIELGEVEAVLAAHPGVKQTIVVARPDERGDKRLVGYVVAQRGEELTPEQLRAYLKDLLPEQMIPAALVMLGKLPLNANGKIDRQKLPEPEEAISREKLYVAPRTPTEEVVAGIWKEVFRRERIGVDDNFFEIGGHSLLATQVVSRVREHYHVELAMRILFDRPTIQSFAESVDTALANNTASPEPEIMPVSRDAYRIRRV